MVTEAAGIYGEKNDEKNDVNGCDHGHRVVGVDGLGRVRWA